MGVILKEIECFLQEQDGEKTYADRKDDHVRHGEKQKRAKREGINKNKEH